MNKLDTDYHTIYKFITEHDYWDAGPDTSRIIARSVMRIFKTLDIEAVDKIIMEDVVDEVRMVFNDATAAVIMVAQKAIREF